MLRRPAAICLTAGLLAFSGCGQSASRGASTRGPASLASLAPSPAQPAPLAPAPAPALEAFAELRPAPDPTLHVVAVSDGPMQLANFDRSRALLIASRQIFTLDPTGVTPTAIQVPSVPEGFTTEELGGDWAAQRLWYETTPNGLYRAKFGATGPSRATFELDKQPILRRVPVFFRGAWMSLEQRPGAEDPPTSEISRFVILDGDARAQRPTIEKQHLVIDCQMQGNDLWAVVLPPSGEPENNKVVRWRVGGGAGWDDIPLPKRHGSTPKAVRLLPSNGTRIYVEVSVPRVAGVDPKGEEFLVSMSGGPARPWTETTRDIVARFDGKGWSFIEQPEGLLDRIEEDANGGVYAVLTERGPLHGVFYRAPSSTTWKKIALGEIRVVAAGEVPSPRAFEQLIAQDAIVRDGTLWISAKMEGASARERWALLRTKRVDHLQVLRPTP